MYIRTSNETEFFDVPCAFNLTMVAQGTSAVGVVKSPLDSSLGLIIFELVCCVFGIPLNMTITSSILRSMWISCKPRNVFQLGIILSNFCSFVRSIIDIFYFFSPSELTCKTFIAFSILPDAFLLFQSFLSLVDRFVAIRFPLWHRAKVTVPLAILLVSFGFVLQIGTIKFMYIAQLVPITSRLRTFERTVNLFSMLVPFVLCFAARVTVYIQTKKILADNCAFSSVEESVQVVACSEYNLSTRTANQIHLGPRLTQKTINRLEIRANKVLAIGVTSLLLISFPLVAVQTLMTICSQWFNRANYCSYTFGWTFPYLKQFGQIHGVYHPIIYMAWNEEFSVGCCT